MDRASPDHYATLGLDRRCSLADIRSSYRLLVKRHHPDVNDNSEAAIARVQELNAAHEALSDPARRRAYDRQLDDAEAAKRAPRTQRIERNIAKDVHLRLVDFIRGTDLELQVADPANPGELERYQLHVPPGSAPGARFRLPRVGESEGGFIVCRLRAMPGGRFKVRGSALQTELRISARRAADGGTENVATITGAMMRVNVPARVKRGEMIRVIGEGLPKPRGGRGDLLVRVSYRPEVRVLRTGR